MHIPDGFLSLPVMISTNIVSAGIIYPSIKKLNKNMTTRRIPLIGLFAAFIFTAQMLSFPVLGGTSVHISGAVLIASILGPFSALIITSSAIFLQSILFQHGGLLTMGANILNIAIIQSLLGYAIYRIFSKKNKVSGLAFAAFSTKIIAATFCAFELILSQTIPLKAGLTAMLSSHFIAGIIEGAVLSSIYLVITRLRPELLELKKI